MTDNQIKEAKLLQQMEDIQETISQLKEELEILELEYLEIRKVNNETEQHPKMSL